MRISVSDTHVTTFLACVFMLGLCSCAKTDAAGEKIANILSQIQLSVN